MNSGSWTLPGAAPEPADDETLARPHPRLHRCGAGGVGGIPRSGRPRPGHHRQPDLPGMHENAALIAGGRCRRPGHRARRGGPGGQLLRRPAPRDGGLRLGLLRLQRRRAGDHARCSTRASARSPTSTSTPITVTGYRPRSTTTTGADRVAARDPADAVPGHRLARRARTRARAGHRGQRRAARRNRGRGLAQGLSRGRPRLVRPSGRKCWSPSTALTRTGRIRWPT